MIIRKARLKDVSSLLKLAKEFVVTVDNIVFSNEKRLKEHIIRRKDAKKIWTDFVKKKIRANNAVVYVAEDNGQFVGYSIVYIKNNHPPIFTVKKIGYFSDLFVKKDYRKKGIATKFKELGFKYLKEKGIKHVSIAVSPHNKLAHSVYNKWGFLDYHLDLRKKI